MWVSQNSSDALLGKTQDRSVSEVFGGCADGVTPTLWPSSSSWNEPHNHPIAKSPPRQHSLAERGGGRAAGPRNLSEHGVTSTTKLGLRTLVAWVGWRPIGLEGSEKTPACAPRPLQGPPHSWVPQHPESQSQRAHPSCGHVSWQRW